MWLMCVGCIIAARGQDVSADHSRMVLEEKPLSGVGAAL